MLVRLSRGLRDPAVLIVGATLAATLVLVAALAPLGPRITLMAGLIAAVGVTSAGASTGVRLALVVIPFMALLRRMTAGTDAYIENDPLVLLPMALCMPALVASLSPSTWQMGRWVSAYVIWLVITGLLALPVGPVTVTYGLVLAGVPILVGLAVAGGYFRTLPNFAFDSAAVLGIPVALYGVMQAIDPAPWDLAWLATVQDQINSIGDPVPGEFRVFGSMEAPLPFALYLGLSAVVILARLLDGAGDRTARLHRIGLAVVALPLLLAAVLLSSVRSVLFALPLVLLAVALLRGGTGRWTTLFAGVAAVGLIFLAPQLDRSPDNAEGDRYEVSELGQDQSYTDRMTQIQSLGPEFTRPFGSGPATASAATRLSGDDEAANTDNGYVTLLVEGGVVRLGLFIAVAFTAVGAAVRRVRDAALPPDDRRLALVVLTTLLYFLALQASFNVVDGASGLFFWIAVGTALRSAHRHGKIRQGSEVNPRIAVGV